MEIAKLTPTGREWVGILVGAILGVSGGYLVSAHFSSKETKEAIATAVKEAEDKAFSAATAKAEQEFQRTAPERLEEMFPQIFQMTRDDSRDSGYSEGYNAGRNEGDSLGYARGIAEGNARTIDVATRLEHYISDWNNYESLVLALSSIAADLEGNRGDSELESQLLSRAEAVVQIADGLRIVHEREAFSFNSLIGDLSRALRARNMPEVRRISRALSDANNTKREIFLSSKKRELELFSSLASKN